MRILAILAVGGIVLAGVIAAVFSGPTGEVGALTVGGIASTLGVCLAFYAVGRSEDRQRERDQRASDS